MAFIKKAKVGDYVKIIKKLPYKDQEYDVEIGDIGIVNYVASTGKYSVHIDGKKNPRDEGATKRSYGKLYDFWIPFECCEVIDSEELIKKCLFENADALDDCKIAIGNDGIIINNGYAVGKLYTGDSYTTTASTCTYTIKDTITDYFTEKKEREENKMKEIKNQKVVDLYFERKKEALEEKYKTAKEAIVEADKNYIFVKQLKKQFKEYIDENEIEGSLIEPVISLPLTTESIDTLDKVGEDNYKKTKELYSIKEEITALLSGCETYEQEMEILRSYNIVTVDNKLVETN